MLKQRNIIVVSMLLGASSHFGESGLVHATKLMKQKTAKAADDDEDAEAAAPAKNHPPKEVSHFKQAQVKKWLKDAWWRDNALPTTPSYNDADGEATAHPMGSTFAQKDNQWTDGNGTGSEKLDYWWHIDHHQRTVGENYKFDDKASKPSGELSSWNHGDAEPTHHPAGITAQVNNNANKNSMAQWWTHGNGQGSEKWDHVEEAARFSNSQDEFHQKMKQGNFLPNMNHGDSEPEGHPMGMTAQVNEPGSMAQWWTHGNGQGSEKWDHAEEAARFSNSQDEFHQKMKQGNFLPNMNQDDAEPAGHPMGSTVQLNDPNNKNQHNLSQKKSKWWTHGNGQGSEKWDAFEEAARFVDSDAAFDQKVRLQANFMPNVNGADGEPTSHPLGFTAQIGSRGQVGSGGKAKWWVRGNGQGSEKWDAFEEAARFSNSQDEFENRVKLQGNFMPSDHSTDGEPAGHPMGFSFVQRDAPASSELLQRPETDHERFWMNIEGANAKDEQEFNAKAAKVKLPASNEEDGPPPMPAQIVSPW